MLSQTESWAVAAAAVAGATALTRVVQTFVVRRLARLTDRTANTTDDLLVDLVRRITTLFIAAALANMAPAWVSVPSAALTVLRAAFIVACVYQGGIWGNGVILYLLERRRVAAGDDGGAATTLAAIGIGARMLLWTALILLGLQNAGINVTALITGLGIGGVAIALAVQNILGDIFASVAIVLDRPFVLGDFIIIGDLAGTVEHIGLKTTRIRSLFGEQLIVSNAELLRMTIKNYKRMQERRIVFGVGVTYQTPHAVAAAIPKMVREAVEAQDGVRFDRAHFKEYGDSALQYEIVYYVLSSDYNKYMDIQQAINLAIYERFGSEGIDFAYPTRTLFAPDMAEALRAAGQASATP